VGRHSIVPSRGLDEDERVPWREFADGERLKGERVIDHESAPEEWCGRSDGDAIGSRISDDDEQTIDASVPLFLRDAAHLGLRIDDPRFEFSAADPTAWISQRQVPCATIPDITDRDFASNGQRASDHRLHRFCEPEVSRVT
jgi:hypothetical protein